MRVKSFGDFVTDDMVIRLLAKERGKYVAKNKNKKPVKIQPSEAEEEKPEQDENSDTLYGELSTMIPPRSRWVNAGFDRRPAKPKGNGVEKWTYSRRVASARAYVSIVKLREKTPEAPWAVNLQKFLDEIHDIVEGRVPVKLEAPTVYPQFKEVDEETGDHIFRPICVYDDLKTKILLALAYKYVVTTFDSCFHRNMLFMRSVQYRGKRQWAVPNYQDAIREVLAYRKRNEGRAIFVGECDIQKFYDIFNHDDILDCFRELYGVAAARTGVDPAVFEPFTVLLKAYLDSYDYYGNVMKLNDPSHPTWKKVKVPKGARARFKWVSDDKFIGAGCYDEDTLREAKEGGKLGIPQGGALSGIIVNVVMQSIDKDIVSGRDPGRLFIRYCDDILLMHTDKAKCENYLDIYYKGLRAHKLIPHPGHDVKEFKNGSRTLAGYWGVKSKNVFLWGHGRGDASDWIAFVGYEIRRTGEVRFRKDKIDKEFKRIANAYYQSIRNSKEDPDARLDPLRTVSSHFGGDPVRTADRYALAQARHLDKYLIWKYKKAARKHGVDVNTAGYPVWYADMVGL